MMQNLPTTTRKITQKRQNPLPRLLHKHRNPIHANRIQATEITRESKTILTTKTWQRLKLKTR